MKFKLIDETEREKFNLFVSDSDFPHFLQLFEWGSVKEGTGWLPFRAVVEDPAGQIRAAALALLRRIPLPGKSLLYLPRGPAVRWHDREALQTLWAGIRQLAKDQKAILCKIDPEVPVQHESIARRIHADGFRQVQTGKSFESVQPRFAMPLSIEPEAGLLMQSFHHKTRYNIRLASRKGVEVREGGEEDLKPFYALLQETAERDRFLIRGFDYYLLLWQHMIEPGHAKLFVALYDSEMIAGTIAFRCGAKAWYIYGASGNRHRETMPNYLLQWEMIRWARQSGCRMYDFGGVSGEMNPEHPLYGLYRFKRGFGAELVEYIGEFDLPLEPVSYWAWTGGMPWLRKARSSMIRSLRRTSGRWQTLGRAKGR